MYTGKSDMDAVIRFFEENMPANGWQNGMTQHQGKNAELSFAKDMETVQISLSYRDDGIQVLVHLTPAK